MSLYPKFRDVHLWAGLILLVPLVLIGGTGILLNHERALGLKPGPQGKKAKSEKASADASTEFVASRETLARQATATSDALSAANDLWGDVPLDRVEIKNEKDLGMVVKVKAHESAGVSPEEIVWSVDSGEIIERKGEKMAGVNWAKVAIDLHTGKIFSKQYGFFWSDAAAGAILLLSATGVFLYVFPMVKKRLSRKKKAAAGKSPAPAAIAARKRAELTEPVA